MYGLLSKAYNNYRIKKESNIEGYRYKNNEDFIFMNMLESILSIFILLIAFDIFLVNKLEVPYLALLLFSLYIPFFGDFVAMAIFIYWMLNVRNNTIIFSKLY